MRHACLFIAFAACGGTSADGPRGIDGTPVTVGTASLEVPAGWKATLTGATSRQVWVPEQNDRRESLTVRVVDRKDSTTVDDLLDDAVDAERALADVQLGRQYRITTPGGIPGIWIDLRFVPDSVDAVYARTQLTLVTERHVIDIFYTARDADSANAAIDLALTTLKEEG